MFLVCYNLCLFRIVPPLPWFVPGLTCSQIYPSLTWLDPHLTCSQFPWNDFFPAALDFFTSFSYLDYGLTWFNPDFAYCFWLPFSDFTWSYLFLLWLDLFMTWFYFFHTWLDFTPTCKWLDWDLYFASIELYLTTWLNPQLSCSQLVYTWSFFYLTWLDSDFILIDPDNIWFYPCSTKWSLLDYLVLTWLVFILTWLYFIFAWLYLFLAWLCLSGLITLLEFVLIMNYVSLNCILSLTLSMLDLT